MGTCSHEMSAIDYSKWDAIDCSDDEEDEEDFATAAPRVTRLDGGSAVTIQGLNDAANGAVTMNDSASDMQVDEQEEEDEMEEPSTAITMQHRNTSALSNDMLSMNGGRTGCGAFWSQDKASCIVSVIMAAGTRARDVKVVLGKKRILVSGKGGEVALDGELAHDIIETSEPLEWELKDLAADPEKRRLCCVTMIKKAPEVVTLWWPRVLTTDQKIDTTQIQGREKSKAGEGRSVWEEAHKMFKDKVSKIEKQEVEI